MLRILCKVINFVCEPCEVLYKEQKIKFDECDICYMENVKLIRYKNCDHYICEKCYNDWKSTQIYKLRVKPKCHMCRAKI